MKKNNLRLTKKVVRNDSDIDICVEDAFGRKYVLFPQEEKRLIVFVRDKKK